MPPVHGAPKGVHHVCLVQHGLADEHRARVEIALRIALVDARDLVRERRNEVLLVINAGEPQEHIRYVPVLGADHLLGCGLGLGIFPCRCDRLTLVDMLAWPAGSMDQHGARVDELLDLEGLQAAEQVARAVDVDALIERVGFAGEIEIGDEMDDADDAGAELLAEFGQRQLDGSRIGKIGSEDRKAVVLGCAIESDDAIFIFKRGRERAPDIAACTGDQDDRAVVRHAGKRALIVRSWRRGKATSAGMSHLQAGKLRMEPHHGGKVPAARQVNRLTLDRLVTATTP